MRLGRASIEARAPTGAKEMASDRTWLITGCSSGFGRELVLELIERGERIVATARKPEAIADLVARAPDRVLACELDVTKAGTIMRTVADAEARFGRIDVLVNNAGYALFGAVEEVPDDQIRAIFETNFFGFVAVTKAVLPGMRARRHGRIINISSVGGISGGLAMGYYAATKFAMAAITESLRQEVAPLGIAVTVVEPGAHQTNIVNRATHSRVSIDDYKPTVGLRSRQISALATSMRGDPRLAARAMIAVADSPQPPVHLPLGEDALARLNAKLKMLVDDRNRWIDLIRSTKKTGSGPV